MSTIKHKSDAKYKFDVSIERGEHFLTIFDLVCNKRKYAARQTWQDDIKACMNWNKKDSITRIDGINNDSVLVLRNSDIDLKKFSEEYASELLRASLVTAVSALDRYMHDLVVDNCVDLLSKPEKDVPRGLKKLDVSVLAVKGIVDNAQGKKGARSREKLKSAIMDVVHKSTFQSSGGIDECMHLLGVIDIWKNVSRQIGQNFTPESLQNKLNEIVRRRNKIVHEADIGKKTRRGKGQPLGYKSNPMKREEAEEYLNLIKSFIDAVDKVI